MRTLKGDAPICGEDCPYAAISLVLSMAQLCTVSPKRDTYLPKMSPALHLLLFIPLMYAYPVQPHRPPAPIKDQEDAMHQQPSANAPNPEGQFTRLPGPRLLQVSSRPGARRRRPRDPKKLPTQRLLGLLMENPLDNPEVFGGLKPGCLRALN